MIHTARPAPNASRPTFRLSVVASAILLSMPVSAAPVSWDGGGGSSFWDVATNWSTDLRPTAADDVTIGAVPLVSIRSASGFGGAVARSVDSSAADFRLTAVTLTLSAPSSFQTLSQTAGILTSTSSLAIEGGSWTGGAQNGAGTTTFAAGHSFEFGGATLYADGGRVFRNEGTLSVASGSGNWSMDLNFTPGGSQPGAARIENAGTFAVSPVLNRSVTVGASNGGVGDTGADATFTNTGSFNKTGAGTATFNVQYLNSGTTTVTLQPGLEAYGSLSVARGSRWESGSSLTGNGRVILSGTAADPNVFKNGSAVTVASLNAFTGATTIEAGASFTPDLLTIHQGTLTVMEGALFDPAHLEMTSSGVLDLRSNNLTLPTGTLIGSGLIRGTGTVTFEEAVLRGARFKGAGTALFANGSSNQWGGGQAGSLALDGGRILRNEGLVTLDVSAAGGNWTADLNSSLDGSEIGAGRIENAGTMVWTTYLNRSITFSASNQGTGDTGSSARIDNTGTISQTGPGAVVINTLLNNSGTIDIAANSTLNFYGGTLDNKAGGKVTGGGLVYLQYLNPAVPHTLRSGSTFSVGAVQIWGDVRIEDNAVFNPGYAFVRQVNGSTLTKLGTQSLIWRDGILDVQSKVVVQQDVPFILRGGRLTGSGTVEMVGAASATAPTVVAEGGVVAPGGSLGSEAGSDFYNGTLTITGDYEQQRPAMLEIDLKYLGGATTNPSVGADKLAVSGEAHLGGVLVVELGTGLNPQYMMGRQYTVLTSQRLFGTFDVLASLGDWGNYGYAVEYLDGTDADAFADQVRITINGVPLPPPPPPVPVPEPTTWALMLAGAGLLAARSRRR